MTVGAAIDSLQESVCGLNPAQSSQPPHPRHWNQSKRGSGLWLYADSCLSSFGWIFYWDSHDGIEKCLVPGKIVALCFPRPVQVANTGKKASSFTLPLWLRVSQSTPAVLHENQTLALWLQLLPLLPPPHFPVLVMTLLLVSFTSQIQSPFMKLEVQQRGAPYEDLEGSCAAAATDLSLALKSSRAGHEKKYTRGKEKIFISSDLLMMWFLCQNLWPELLPVLPEGLLERG